MIRTDNKINIVYSVSPTSSKTINNFGGGTYQQVQLNSLNVRNHTHFDVMTFLHGQINGHNR